MTNLNTICTEDSFDSDFDIAKEQFSDFLENILNNENDLTRQEKFYQLNDAVNDALNNTWNEGISIADWVSIVKKRFAIEL